MGIIAFAACWLAAAQEVEVLAGATQTPAPFALTSGLVTIPWIRAPWQPIRLVGGGVMAHGVAVPRPSGAVVRAVMAGFDRPSPITVRIVRGAGADLPRPTLTTDGGDVDYACEGFTVRFLGDGSVMLGGARCELVPRGPRDAGWQIVDCDPMRTVLAFRAKAPPSECALTLYAAIVSRLTAVELTLVVRGEANRGAAALGLRLCGAEVSEAAREEADAASRPVGDALETAEQTEEDPAPPFEVAIADAAVLLCDAHACADDRVVVDVRRHGPTAPATVERSGTPMTSFFVVDAGQSVAPGERKLLRARLSIGPRGGDPIVRPLGALPHLGASLGSVRHSRALEPFARKVGAGLAAFRSDPRHGLLWRRDDLGDWKLDPFKFGNLEWDTSFGLMLRFLDGSGAEDAAFALMGTEHLFLRDRDAESGLFFQHGRSHQSGVVEPGHHWAEGAAAVAAWTDDPWLADEVTGLAADQAAAFGKLDLERALPRSLGWALTALCALHAWAPDRKASAASIAAIARFLVKRQHETGHFLLEPATSREGSFRISPFVDGGIVVPALERAAALMRSPLVSDAARRCRIAIVRDGVVMSEDGPRLCSSILIDGRTGRPYAQAGVAEGEEVVLFLSGVAGTDRAVEGELRAYAEKTLALESRTYLGKPLSMLLRALPSWAGRLR